MPGKRMAIHIGDASCGEAAAHAAGSGCDIHRPSPSSPLPPGPCRRWGLAQKPFTQLRWGRKWRWKRKAGRPKPHGQATPSPRPAFVSPRSLLLLFGRPVTWFSQRPRPSPLPLRHSEDEPAAAARTSAHVPMRPRPPGASGDDLRLLWHPQSSRQVTRGIQVPPRVSFPFEPRNPAAGHTGVFSRLEEASHGYWCSVRHLPSVAGGFPRACKIQQAALS